MPARVVRLRGHGRHTRSRLPSCLERAFPTQARWSGRRGARRARTQLISPCRRTKSGTSRGSFGNSGITGSCGALAHVGRRQGRWANVVTASSFGVERLLGSDRGARAAKEIALDFERVLAFARRLMAIFGARVAWVPVTGALERYSACASPLARGSRSRDVRSARCAGCAARATGVATRNSVLDCADHIEVMLYSTL